MQPKSGENSPASLSAEKANEFNRHFANVGPKIAAEISSGNNTDRPLPPRPPCVTTTGLTLRAITLPELSSALSELSASQAVGLDGLPIAAVRKCFAVIGPHILHLVNSSICTRTFPAAWKEASVVPLFKSGSRDEASSFRPISILSVLSKICGGGGAGSSGVGCWTLDLKVQGSNPWGTGRWGLAASPSPWLWRWAVPPASGPHAYRKNSKPGQCK